MHLSRSAFTSVALTLFDDLLDLFAPRTCAACAEPFPSVPAPRRRACLCSSCAITLEAPVRAVSGVHAPYVHAGPLMRAIHRAKYGEHPRVARALGSLFAHAAGAHVALPDLLVPVPLHTRRLASRGFNQAHELARAFATAPATNIVTRVRHTPSQVGLGRTERLENVRDAFAVPRPERVRGRGIVVVDDVVTTGATLAEVARVLHAAGAREVRAVALASAPIE